MKIWAVLFPIIFYQSYAKAQLKLSENLSQLSIGDTVPDLLFHQVLNYSGESARLSDFTNKMVILDFWATWCGSCISALPELKALKSRFRNELEIVMATYEPIEKVRQFQRSNRIFSSVDFPVITDDTSLSRLFPHKMIPHEVWIDRHRVVRAITGSDLIDQNHLKTWLSTGSIDLPVKDDFIEFDRNKPLSENTRKGIGFTPLFQSTLTRAMEGVGSMTGIGYSEDSLSRRLYYINLPVLYLYLASLNRLTLANRIVLEVKDSSKYLTPEYSSIWSAQNNYCYELVYPSETSIHEAKQIMFRDLNAYLGLNAYVTRRKMKCLVMYFRNQERKRIKTQGGKPAIMLYNRDTAFQYLKNQPLEKLVSALNSQTPGRTIKPVVINETGIDFHVDLELSIEDIHNVDKLKKELNKYGLDIKEEERELEVLVLSDRSVGMQK